MKVVETINLTFTAVKLMKALTDVYKRQVLKNSVLTYEELTTAVSIHRYK